MAPTKKAPKITQKRTSSRTVKLPERSIDRQKVEPTNESENITEEETINCKPTAAPSNESESPKQLIYGCGLCTSYYDSKSALSEHRKGAHNVDSPCLIESTKYLSVRQPKCNICQSFYITKWDLIHHQKIAHDLNPESFEPPRFKCLVCSADFAHKNILVRHLERAHSIDLKDSKMETYSEAQCEHCHLGFKNKIALAEHLSDAHSENMNVSLIQKDGKCKFQCSICRISFVRKQSLFRHRRQAHKIVDPGNGTCHHCGKTFHPDRLSSHEKTCVKKTKPRRRQDCSFKDCTVSFYKKEDLIEHMKSVHRMRIEPMRILRFKTEEDFEAWKEEEEGKTYSYFSRHAGTKNNKRSYYCQHEGTSKSHRSSEDTSDKKKQNKKGRIKMGCVCTAYMRTTTSENEVEVNYWPTHNHPLSPDDVKHQPLSKATIAFIKEQIALNVPIRQIQTLLKKRLSENSVNTRDAQVVSLKRINSLAQRYHRSAAEAGSTPNAAVETFNSFIDVLVSQEDSPVLFYQPPSKDANLDCPNIEDHLFFLGLQTTDQQKMLQRDIAMPMFISYTKADYTFQYYLISILVLCENNFEYPVGHLMTSQLNEEVISLFLQVIGERCPELNVNCIVSVDCPVINNSIKKVFGDDGPYFLSKWHFLEFMRNEFLKSVPTNKIEELFDFILAMVEAETEDRFLFLYNTFKEQFENEFPDIVSNFAEYFVRASMWASCYRQAPGIIDSCLYADSFFNKLNKKYRRRPNKSINVVPDLLLFMQEEYNERRETKQMTCDIEEMKEQHNMASEIPSDLVQEVFSHHWTVQSSKHGQSFSVMRCVSRCLEKDCKLRCSDCVNLCSHKYFCNCGKSAICQHVHKVHQQYGSLIETEDDYPYSVDVLINPDEEMENCNNNSTETEEQEIPVISAEVLRADIFNYIEKVKTAINNMPLGTLSVCHETLQSLCNVIDGDSVESV